MKINPNQLEKQHEDFIMQAEALTVEELMTKLERMPKEAKVYMVFDKVSEEAWDERLNRWRYAVPLASVTEETIFDVDTVSEETNVILEVKDY